MNNDLQNKKIQIWNEHKGLRNFLSCPGAFKLIKTQVTTPAHCWAKQATYKTAFFLTYMSKNVCDVGIHSRSYILEEVELCLGEDQNQISTWANESFDWISHNTLKCI